MNPKGRVPRACPWVNVKSPEGRRAKLEMEKVPLVYPWDSTLELKKIKFYN